MDTPAQPLPASLAGLPPPHYIAAPSPVYLTGEEFLQISSLASSAGLTLTVSGRVLRPDNTISRVQFTHAPASTRTLTTTRVALPEGWLLGLRVVETAGATTFGEVWCSLDLVLGNTGATIVDQTLAYGFCTASVPLAWPGNVNTLAIDGPGRLRSIHGTQPGAGGDIIETVPTAARWELLAFSASLVTSATVASRVPVFNIDDGTNTFFRIAGNGSQAASQNFQWGWFAGVGSQYTDGFGDLVAPMLLNNRLSAGFRLRTTTGGIQAADQWSAPQYLVRETFDA